MLRADLYLQATPISPSLCSSLSQSGRGTLCLCTGPRWCSAPALLPVAALLGTNLLLPGTRPTVPTRPGGSCRHFVELLLGEVAATKMVGVSGTFIPPLRALGLAGLLQKQVILLERVPGGAVWWGGLGRVSGAGTDTKFGGFQCQCLKHFVLSLAVVFSKILYLCINCCQKRETVFIN